MTHELKFKLATGIFVIGALAPYVLWGANVYSGGFCSGFAFAWFMLAVADKASLEKPIGQIGFLVLPFAMFGVILAAQDIQSDAATVGMGIATIVGGSYAVWMNKLRRLQNVS